LVNKHRQISLRGLTISYTLFKAEVIVKIDYQIPCR
jgi:hypothetical protein